MNYGKEHYFKQEKIDKEVLVRLKEKLSQLKYKEHIIKERLNLFGPYLEINELQRPLLRFYVETDDPLDIIISVFFIGLRVPLFKLNRIISSNDLHKLIEMKLLETEGENIWSPIRIYPFKGYFFVTGPVTPDGRDYDDSVYRIGIDSFFLASAIPAIQAESALDLCCGSGVQAIIASSKIKKVLGVDLNPLAVDFAKFNAIFNDVKNTQFITSNIYENIVGKYDLIIANPPFISVPYNKPKIMYRDSGKLGVQHTRQIIKGLPYYLKKGGLCLIMTGINVSGINSNIKNLRNTIGDTNLDILQISLAQECTCSACYAMKHSFPYFTYYGYEMYKKESTKFYKNLLNNGIKEIIPAILCIKNSGYFRFQEKKIRDNNVDIKELVKQFYYFSEEFNR